MNEKTEFKKFQESLDATIASGTPYFVMTVDEAKRLEVETRVLYILNEQRKPERGNDGRQPTSTDQGVSGVEYGGDRIDEQNKNQGRGNGGAGSGVEGSSR